MTGAASLAGRLDDGHVRAGLYQSRPSHFHELGNVGTGLLQGVRVTGADRTAYRPCVSTAIRKARVVVSPPPSTKSPAQRASARLDS